MVHRKHSDAGWIPYALPFVSFLLLAQLRAEVPAAAVAWLLGATAVIPGALVVFFARRGAYPELASFDGRPGALLQDVVIGLASAALWVVPYLVFAFDFGEGTLAFLGPDRSAGFDPRAMGAGSPLVLLMLRMVGFVIVVPVIEELFIRSFMMRFLQAHAKGHAEDADFRTLPIARYTRLGLWGTAAVFTLGHAPWEWWVALPWFIGTTLWFYYRRSLLSIVVVHAVANAAILVFVTTMDGRLLDGAGRTLPLWFFL